MSINRVLWQHRLGHLRYLSSVSSNTANKVHAPPPPPPTSALGQWTNIDVTSTENVERFQKWKWLFDKLGYFNEDDKLHHQSGSLFHSCVNQAAIPSFYDALSLEPDFRGQQALLTTHVWMVHRRLMLENDGTEKGKIMQEQVFDRVWEETMLRLRHQGIAELTLTKYLKEVQQFCFSSCVAYDKGLATSKDDGLVAPLQKHLFNVDSGKAFLPQAKVMARYMLRELQNLKEIPFENLVLGSINWGNPPKSSNSTSSEAYEIIGQSFPGEWRSALEISGKVFYWNTKTRVSSWNLPK